MPVVTTTFSTTAGQVWASPTWSSSDPSKKVHDQLSAWVNAINDPTKIELIHSPGDATSRSSGSVVRWLLRARESDTSSDYGILFSPRQAGLNSPQYATGGYYNRAAGSGNNGAGTYNTIGSSLNISEIDDYSGDHYVAYRADGDLPWFLYSAKCVISAQPYAFLQLLLRVSTSDIAAGSYYPSTGIGKWVYATRGISSFSSQPPTIWTPVSSATAPYKGAWSGNETLRSPVPAATYGNGYFFRLGAQYGINHYLGAPNYNDFLVSNYETGSWGDTVVIASVTYTRVGPFGLWVRSS